MTQGQYTRTEVVDVARQLELCGEAFYDEGLRHARDPEVKTLLRHLRDEEKAHGRSFDRLLAGIEEAEGEWRDGPEYSAWMRGFAIHQVFPDPAGARAVVRGLSDDAALLDHAIGFEQQTVEFFEHLRDMVRAEDKAVIESLIDEEREHERLLRERRARLHS